MEQSSESTTTISAILPEIWPKIISNVNGYTNHYEFCRALARVDHRCNKIAMAYTAPCTITNIGEFIKCAERGHYKCIAPLVKSNVAFMPDDQTEITAAIFLSWDMTFEQIKSMFGLLNRRAIDLGECYKRVLAAPTDDPHLHRVANHIANYMGYDEFIRASRGVYHTKDTLCEFIKQFQISDVTGRCIGRDMMRDVFLPGMIEREPSLVQWMKTHEYDEIIDEYAGEREYSIEFASMINSEVCGRHGGMCEYTDDCDVDFDEDKWVKGVIFSNLDLNTKRTLLVQSGWHSNALMLLDLSDFIEYHGNYISGYADTVDVAALLDMLYSIGIRIAPSPDDIHKYDIATFKVFHKYGVNDIPRADNCAFQHLDAFEYVIDNNMMTGYDLYAVALLSKDTAVVLADYLSKKKRAIDIGALANVVDRAINHGRMWIFNSLDCAAFANAVIEVNNVLGGTKFRDEYFCNYHALRKWEELVKKVRGV